MADIYEDTIVRTRAKAAVKPPKLWSVLFVNDDYTPMEFVVLVLTKVLRLDLDDATRVMLEVHQKGKSAVGRYTKDIAETKCMQIVSYAREQGHPLVVEPVEA